MNTLTNEEFAARVAELARPVERFVPTAYYDPDGDCVEFLAQPDNFHAERIDELVTVYYSEETGEIIGSLLKGVSRFWADVLERLPAFKLVIQDGKVKLVYIFLAKQLLANQPLDPEKLATVTYKKLIDVANQTEVEMNLKKAG
jgi:hypothetical protein